MVHEVRKEYLDVCATLEPAFDPGCVHWPRKDVLCSPLWGTAWEAASPQNQSQTSLMLQLKEEHVQEVPKSEDGATPSHIAQSTEETVPVHAVPATYGPIAPLPSTTEDMERQDGSVSPLLAAKDHKGNETDTVSSLPAATDHVERGICSPPGGLQTSTLGSVSDLSVSSSQLSLSIEEDDCMKSDSRTSMQEDGTDGTKLKQEKEEESNEALIQSANTREQCQPHSMTGKGSPPKTVLTKERPGVEVQHEEVCESQRKDVYARGNDASPDAPEELFFREISAIIASAEQEGKSYEGLKAQLELELVWVRQAIHSRQQVIVHTVHSLCAVCVCMRTCMCAWTCACLHVYLCMKQHGPLASLFVSLPTEV